jgi:hypothetical protein
MKNNERVSYYIRFNYLADKLMYSTFQRIQFIKAISNNRTKTYQGLDDEELLKAVNQLNTILIDTTEKDYLKEFDSMNEMRRKIWGVLNAQFGVTSSEDCDSWLLSKGTHKKVLNELSYNELVETCAQMDAINKKEPARKRAKMRVNKDDEMSVQKGGEE